MNTLRTYVVDGQAVELLGQPLSSEEFQDELDEMVREAGLEGWLFVLRNKLPQAMVAKTALHQGGVQLHYSEDHVAEYYRKLYIRGQALLRNRRRLTVVIPKYTGRFFRRSKALLLPRAVTPSGSKPDSEALESAWKAFCDEWADSEALRVFDPGKMPNHPDAMESHLLELENEERRRLRLPDSRPLLNFLPDTWICMTRSFLESAPRGGPRTRSDARDLAERRLVDLALGFSKDKSARRSDTSDWLQGSISNGSLRIVKLSGCEINSRFRGVMIRDAQLAATPLIHAALAYHHSSPSTYENLNPSNDLLDTSSAGASQPQERCC